MGANQPMMTRTFICFLVSILVFNVVQSKEYSDQTNQGYSVALPYGASSSSPSSPSSVSSNAGEELQSAAQYQQATYSGPTVNSVASSVYANGPISAADQTKTYNNYGLIQQPAPPQVQQQQQPQVQQQPQSQQSLQQSIQSLQPIYQLLNYGQSHQSQLNYDQTQQPQQQQQQQQQQHPQLPVQQSQLNYGAVVDNGDYNGVKTALNSQNAQSAPGAPKKTVILAIPVKLALQAAENKGSYDDKQQAQQPTQQAQQAQQPVQQSQQQSAPQQNQQTYSGPGPSISYATPNYQSSRQYDGVKGYGDHGNDHKNNDYRVNSPVYNSQSSYGQSGQSYDNSNSNSQSYSSPSSTSSSGGKSSYNRDSNQYDQQKFENKNNGGSAYNGNNPYVQMKESNYMGTKGKSSQSSSNENQSDSGYSGKDSSSDNAGFDEESYEGNKGSDSYKGSNNPNNYGANKDDSYPSPPESMSGYDDDNEDDSSSYSKGSKGYSGSKSKSPSYSSDSDSSYGKQKGNDYPSLTSSYDGDQDDWQSGYSGNLGSSNGRGRGKGGIKGSNNYKFDLSSYSGDDSSSYSGDDSDGKPDTDAIKAALANYGSLKSKIRDSSSGSSGLKVINDYSSLKNYESLKDLSSLSFGSGSKGYGGIKSLSDFSFKDLSTSMKDLSSLKDYASLTKERPKKIKLSSYDNSDSLEDYDSGSSSSGLSSYSGGSESPMSGYSGLSSYDSSSLSLSSEPYSGSSSLTSLRPSKYSSSLGSSSLGSLGDSSYDSLSSGQSYGSSGLSSISSDSSYDIASLSSSPSVAHTSTSGSSYGSSEVLSSLSKMPSSSSFNPTTFTVSDAVNAPESVASFSTYSSPSASLSSSYLSPSGSAADVASSSISAASGLPLSFSNTDSYGSSPSLDLSSLYGSMMKSFSSPIYSPSSQPRPLSFPGSIYPQQQPPMPIQVINTYTSGPAFPPPPPYGFMYGKPGNKPYHPRPHHPPPPPPPPPKYMQNEPQHRPRRFPTVTSPLSLYKGLQGLSSISSPGKFSASSILSSLYASGSSPAKFVIKTNGKGSGLLSSLRLTSSPTSSFSSSSSSSSPSQSSNKKPSFTSPFRLDNIFGQIYKLL